MATPESKVKDAVKKYLTSEGVWHFMAFGGGYGRAGIPDIICCVNGWLVAVECKAGKGHTTALQDREMQRIQDAGGYAIVVSDNPETFIALGDLITRLSYNT